METSFCVSYNERLLKYTVQKYWVYLIGKLGFFSYGLVLSSWAYLFWANERGWWIWVIGGAVIFFTLFGALAYWILWKRSKARFDLLNNGRATFIVEDEYLVIESAAGVVEVRWNLIKKVIQFRDVWLMVLKHDYFSLPLADVSETTRTLILSKVAK